ncbi:MAG: threonine/serine dehydratase [Acidimicrobiales bacterium]
MVSTRSDIQAIAPFIRAHIRETPVLDMDGADIGLDTCIAFKLELFQHSGSFKARGAFANLLTATVPPAGVVAASGGNHGAAVAFAARKIGARARIFVPAVSSEAKTKRIRDYGAVLVVGGVSYEEARTASEKWAAEHGALTIPAFDKPETIAGAGTLALELSAQAPDLDTILVPVGGGGLIGGVAGWYSGDARIVGVEPEDAPNLTHALAAGHPVLAPTGSIAEDSLAPGRTGDHVFPIVQRHVDHVVLVTDDDIRAAQLALWDLLRIVAEPGGAAAFAALLARRYQPRARERIGVVISGGNTLAVDFSLEDPVLRAP